MMRLMTAAVAVALATPALAQDPHGAHAGMQPSGGHADHSAHAAMDHSQHTAPAAGIVTSPRDGAMLMGPPDAFSITFPHPMRLTGVAIATQGAAAIQVDVPATDPATEASVALPTLAPATYRLTWTALGADRHEMTGTVGFMVH